MTVEPAYVSILDVGHGNSTILHDGSDVVIVDCGARGSSLLEYLTRENISSINAIFLSHADQDHIGGLLTVLASSQFEINEIYINADSSKGTKLWDDLVYELDQKDVAGKISFNVGITRPSSFQCGSIKINVTSPSKYLTGKGVGNKDHYGRVITSNSLSASMHLTWHDQVIAYLAGDIDQITLDDLVSRNAVLDAPLLVFPHHGGYTGDYDVVGFTEQLCKLVKPSVVIFSIGRNKHDNPRPEVVQTLKKIVPELRVSCTQLSKHCSAVLPSKTPEHLLALFSKGMSKHECCNGTFVIKLDENMQYLPLYEAHQDFITSFVSTPLCR